MRIIWILALITMISGCATIAPVNAPPAAPKATWPDRVALLSKIQSWSINGKIAIQTNQDAGSATVDWNQSPSHYAISLAGPLGTHSMKLTGQPGHVTLQTSDGKNFSATNPEQLLAERWGFHLPVSNMKYWIRGLPVPGMPASTHFDNFGRLTGLVQQGWNIQYQSYANNNGLDLPSRIAINSAAMRVKIVVYQWHVA